MTGLIPRPFIDELLQRLDLVELIDSYVPLKKQGNAYVACCPFHNEKTPSFNVIAKKQFYHCFGCGVSGNAISFAMNYLQQNFTDAIETLAARIGMQVPREEGQTQKIKQSKNLYQLLAQVSQHYQENLKKTETAIHYLQQRGVSGEIAKQFQLGYAQSGWQVLEKQFPKEKANLISSGMLIKNDDGKTYDRYRHRITFPIHDRHGRIIGFGGRSIDAEQKPKYLNSPETAIFQKNRELYGLHQALQLKEIPAHVFIVEGYLDVIALAQHGIPNCVAALGTATSTYHIQLLAKHFKQLIFCFDGDEAGRQAAWRALQNCLPNLDNTIDPRFVFLPEGQDPDSFIREQGSASFEALVKKAIPLNRYFLDTISANIDLQNSAGKSQLLQASKAHLAVIPPGSYRQLLLDEIARLTHIENHRVEALIRPDNSNKIVEAPRIIQRSPIRLATALVLQHPEIYRQCAFAIDISFMETPELTILRSILQEINNAPQATTAHLIEMWRDSDYFESLSQLASWQHQVPEDALQSELMDILIFLRKQHHEMLVNQLIARSRSHGLSDIEKLQLQTMLQQRHQVVHDKK